MVFFGGGFYTDESSLPERKSRFICGLKNVIACQGETGGIIYPMGGGAK